MTYDIKGDIISIAQRWIGTPYRHQASCEGAGTDCLGLVRGVWRELYGEEPEPIPPYTPDWAQELGQDTLRDAAGRWLTAINKTTAIPGDVMVFRLQPDRPCKHVAILSKPDAMIHAYAGHAVVESALVPWWNNRWAYAYRFPDITRHMTG